MSTVPARLRDLYVGWTEPKEQVIDARVLHREPGFEILVERVHVEPASNPTG